MTTFKITGSDLVGWFTVNGAKLVNVEDLGIDEELDVEQAGDGVRSRLVAEG